MKRIILLIAIIFINSAVSKAAYEQGDLALSVSMTGGSINVEDILNGPTGSSYTAYLYMSFLTDFYIVKGLALEPEIGFMAQEKSNPVSYYFGNLLYIYNFDEQNIGAFARAGIGIGNGIPFPNSYFVNAQSPDINVSLLQFGLGGQYLIENIALIRLELNYRAGFYKHSEYLPIFGNLNIERNIKILSLNLGVGIFID